MKFLTSVLGIDEDIAGKDACKMEHAISKETFERLTKFMEFVDYDINSKPQWLKGFNYYLNTGEKPVCRVRESLKKKKK